MRSPWLTLRPGDPAFINGLPTIVLIDFSIMLLAWDSSLTIPCTQNILSPDLCMTSFQFKGHLFGGHLPLHRVGLPYEGPVGGHSGASQKVSVSCRERSQHSSLWGDSRQRVITSHPGSWHCCAQCFENNTWKHLTAAAMQPDRRPVVIKDGLQAIL